MRLRIIVVLMVLQATISWSASAQVTGAQTEAAKAAIRTLLANQVDAWNRGDLEGFMAGYWKSPELSFVSGATETRGWQPTLDRYRKRYQGEGKEMGKLDFFDFRVEMLGPESAFVRGHWHLQMKDGQEPHGLFTLILRKLPEGWRIVHDHTS